MLSNGHAGFGGRPEETNQPKDWHRASGRPNRAEGMTGKCALRALKRKISDAIYHRLVSDTRQQMRSKTKDPGGQPGNDSASSAAGSHPEPPALRKSHSRVAANPTTRRPAPQPAKPARPTKIVPHAS